MFTSIPAAIEEARFRRALSKGEQVILQRAAGKLIVRERRRGDKPLYSTASDSFCTVNTDEVEA